MRYFYPRLLSAFLLFSCLPVAGAYAQWPNWSNYLDGSIIQSVVDGGDVIWLGSNGGGLMKVNKTTQQVTYYNRANSQLRNMHILAMTRDEAGNLWIGTEGGGLMKFDGNNTWQWWMRRNSSIPSNDINAIATTGNTVWVATDEGLAKYDGTDNYSGWTIYNKDNSQLPDNKVSSVSIGADGSVWAGTFTRGMVKISGDTWTVYRKNSSPLPSDSVTTINANLDGQVWVGFGTGVVAQVSSDPTWLTVNLRLNEMPGFEPTSRRIYEIRKGAGNEILISTYTGLARYTGTSAVTRYPQGNTANEQNAVFSALAANGAIFAGTQSGVAVNMAENWTRVPVTATGMLGSNVGNLMVDKAGTVWLASLGGLTRFNGDKDWKVWGPGTFHFQAVRAIAMDSSDPETHWLAVIDGFYRRQGNNVQKIGTIPGLSNKLSAIATDKTGKIWAGTENGIGRYDGTDWTVYTSETSGLPSGPITALTVDPQGNVWAGTSFNGAAKFDGTTWTAYKPENHPELGSGPIRSIAFGPGGDVWFATVDAGVAKLSGTTWTSYNTANSPLASDNITAVAVDSYGALWAATSGTGVMRFKNGTWNIYSNENSGLTEDRVTSLAIAPDGKIWMGTELSGLVVFDNATATSGVENSPLAMRAVNMLEGNLPNPFNAATAIRLNLPVREQVRLSVVNAQGVEVALLHNGAMEAGEHSVRFDAQGLPAGVYFSRLQVNGSVQTQPMVVAR